jgi:hypothetical protein
MLQEDQQAAQKANEFLREIPAADGHIVTILKENVTLPALLRLRERFDFMIDTIYRNRQRVLGTGPGNIL